MAEEKPKGDPVFLTIAGKKVTLPGVSSLNTDDELTSAANNWISQNYKGADLGAPIVFRTPKMDEKGGFAPGEEIVVRADKARPFEQSVPTSILQSITEQVGTPGLDPATIAALAPDDSLISQFNRNSIQIAQPLLQKLEVANAVVPAALQGLYQLAYNLGISNENPQRSAAQTQDFLNVAGLASGLEVPMYRPKLPTVPEPTPRVKAPGIPAAAEVAAAEAPMAKPTLNVTPAQTAKAAEALDNITAAPPVSEAPSLAANINLGKFEKPAEVKQAINEIAKTNNDWIDSRRGVMSLEELNDLSQKQSLETILDRKVTQPLNAEQIIASRRILNETADDVWNKVQAYRQSDKSDPALRAQAIDAITRHAAFQETLAGGTAEIGRAMRVMRETAPNDKSRALEDLLQNLSSEKDIDAVIDGVSRLNSPEQVSQFIGKIAKPDFKDKALEYWMNALLSGPKTHAVNIVSNLLTTALTVPEKFLASGIGALTGNVDRVTAREIQKRMVGVAQGAIDGVKLAKEAFVTGNPSDFVGTVELSKKAIGGKLGEAVRIPTRMLTAEDEFFKSIHRRAEINAIAYQKARAEAGSDATKLTSLYEQYRTNPTKQMITQADTEARYRTFQKDLGSFGQDVQKMAGKYWPVRFIQPFIRTPANLLKYAGERSPLAPFAKSWRDAVKAGGRSRDEALAKLALGTGVSAMAFMKAMDGTITGSGPSDPEERAALMATGWQPNSIKIGDKYYAYNRLDPISTVIGVMADTVTMKDYMTDEEYNKAWSLIPLSIAKNVIDKNYLQGLSSVMDAWTDPERFGESYINRSLTSAVPNVAAQTARAIDPELREAKNLLDTVKSRIPVWSEDVPNNLDVWGDAIVRTGSMTLKDKGVSEKAGAALFNLASPIAISKTVRDPVKQEVARLKLGLSEPRKDMSLSVDIGQEKPMKFNFELSDQERRQYTYMSGKLAKALIDADMKTPEWQKLNDDERRALIRKRLEFSRDTFRSAIGVKAFQRIVKETGKLPPTKTAG